QPRLQIKHLNSRSSLFRFTAPFRQETPRSRRKHGLKVPPRQGYFADVRTLAAALLSRSFTLGELAQYLKTTPKLGDVEHGAPLTRKYLEYAANDVQVTWECFERLQEQYESYGLTETPITRIYSEASLGKAYLRQMGIQPWRELQPDFPRELLGIIMSSYYGGRSEVHCRRQIARV